MQPDLTQLTLHNNEDESRFEARLGDHLGKIDYRRQANRLALLHTEVPKELEGNGIAGRLAKYAFTYAREHDLRVLIFCPYLTSYLQKHPEYKDVVDLE